MKTLEEIKQLAFLKYPRVINDPYNPMQDDNSYERKIWIDGYNQCQEDNNKEQDATLLINKINTDNEPNIINEIIDWSNFEGELMDWAHNLGQEQKYTPYPAQFLEWLKNNYKIPQKK